MLYKYNKHCNCELKIFNNVVFLTQDISNKGASVINELEAIALEICKEFNLDIYCLIFVLCLPIKNNIRKQERFSVVSFNNSERIPDYKLCSVNREELSKFLFHYKVVI